MLRPVLIADDNADDFFLLKRALLKAGVSNPMLCCVDGDDALTYLERACDGSDLCPAVVILDIDMPGSSGLEVLAWAQGKEPLGSVKFFIVSGSVDPGARHHAITLGALRYFVKPVTIQHASEIAGIVASLNS